MAEAPLTNKDIRWLKEVAPYEDVPETVYRGVHWARAPARFAKLEKRGLIFSFIPQNPSHRVRAQITAAGLAELRRLEANAP